MYNTKRPKEITLIVDVRSRVNAKFAKFATLFERLRNSSVYRSTNLLREENDPINVTLTNTRLGFHASRSELAAKSVARRRIPVSPREIVLSQPL